MNRVGRSGACGATSSYTYLFYLRG